MQWDKVKNILLALLLAINLFLLGSLAGRLWQNASRADALNENLRTLLAENGLTLSREFTLPADMSLPNLLLDRSRADEEAVSLALLGETAERSESEDGAVRFAQGGWFVLWNADGTLSGRLPSAAGATERPEQAARQLLNRCGLLTRDAALHTAGETVTVTAPVAGVPVHDRVLTLHFGEKAVRLSGRWSFGVPYTTARANGVPCVAADGLLAFAAECDEPLEIYEMNTGYRLQADSSRRLQLLPTWRISTNLGDYLVDCAKKSRISAEN